MEAFTLAKTALFYSKFIVATLQTGYFVHGIDFLLKVLNQCVSLIELIVNTSQLLIRLLRCLSIFIGFIFYHLNFFLVLLLENMC